MIGNQEGMFIEGSIGKLEIIREDYKTFKSTIKELEWTDNNLYKLASCCDIRPIFMQSDLSQSQKYSSINFNDFYVNENTSLTGFEEYRRKMESKRIKNKDILEIEKNKFTSECLEGNVFQQKSEVLNYISQNKKKIISNSNLKDKLGNYLTYLS